jgi:hypothetical protein
VLAAGFFAARLAPPIVGLIALAFFIFYIFCWWKIFSKAGYNGALSLINLAVIIPIIGWIAPLVLFIWFAFAKWPALSKPS